MADGIRARPKAALASSAANPENPHATQSIFFMKTMLLALAVMVVSLRSAWAQGLGYHAVERWDLAAGKCLSVRATHQALINWVGVSRKGRVLAAGVGRNPSGGAAAITLWRAGQDRPAAHASLSPDGRILALSNYNGRGIELRAWEQGTNREIPFRFPYGEDEVTDMHWSPNGKRLAAGLDGASHRRVVYETAMWKPVVQIPVAPTDFDQGDGLLQLRGGQLYRFPSFVPARLRN